MSAETASNLKFEIGHILFIDIVAVIVMIFAYVLPQCIPNGLSFVH